MIRFHHRQILEEVAALNMPRPEEVVITHGSALVVRGVRPERVGGDIDIVTSLENNLYLENELGFRAVRMTVGIDSSGKETEIISRRDEEGRFDSHRWDFSMARYNRTGRGRIYLPELGNMSDQDKDTGIWVAKPELVLLTKLETNRLQDEEDARRIEQYLTQGY